MPRPEGAKDAKESAQYRNHLFLSVSTDKPASQKRQVRLDVWARCENSAPKSSRAWRSVSVSGNPSIATGNGPANTPCNPLRGSKALFSRRTDCARAVVYCGFPVEASVAAQDYGKLVSPMRKRSHSLAAPRPSLIAHTTKLWPRRQSPAAKIPGTLVVN